MKNSKREEDNPTRFDITQMLTAMYNDIHEHEVAPETGFADGWMCPLYKKNDRNCISNYRPITLLNTDYKLLTKILTLRMAKVTPSLIHEDQAGFIPGRSITNQTQLTRMIMEYAEANKTNGIIIALDQEKVYDRIAHDYLWRILAAFGIPP